MQARSKQVKPSLFRMLSALSLNENWALIYNSPPPPSHDKYLAMSHWTELDSARLLYYTLFLIQTLVYCIYLHVGCPFPCPSLNASPPRPPTVFAGTIKASFWSVPSDLLFSLTLLLVLQHEPSQRRRPACTTHTPLLN